VNRAQRRVKRRGRGDSRIAPYINLPLSGEVPRRGGGGTEAVFSTVLPGKAYGIPPYPSPGKGGLIAAMNV